jgi:hypothetical protein
MRRHQGIEQPFGIHDHPRVSADDRLPTLILVNSKINTCTEQSMEGSLHAIPPNHILNITRLTARMPKQKQIWTVAVFPNRPAHELEEIRLPPLQSLVKDFPAFQ